MTAERQPLFASLIVATVDRSRELEALLDSLATSTERDFEVILADQNGDERLVVLAERYQASFPIRRLALGARNACLARNAGARIARGRWLGFPDDDCRYRADTLSTLRKIAAARAPRLIAGDVRDDQGRSVIGVGSGWNGSGAAALSLTNVWGRLAEACVFLDRERFLALGGFDPSFGPGGRYFAAEGLELAMRFLADSVKGDAWFEPELVTLHPSKTAPAAEHASQRAFQHGVGIGAAAGAHPRPMALMHLAYLIAKSLGAAARSAPERAVHFDHLRGLTSGFAQAVTGGRTL